MIGFPLEEGERLLKHGGATYEREEIGLWSSMLTTNAMLGTLYLTTERLVFVGHMAATRTYMMEEVLLAHVDGVLPARTFSWLSNALLVTTLRGRRLRFLVQGRDEWSAAILEQVEKWA